MLTLWWHLMDSFWNSKVLQCFASEVSCALHISVMIMWRITLPCWRQREGLILPCHPSKRQSPLSESLTERWKNKAELAPRYVWHILYNFACNFLVYWCVFFKWYCHPICYCSGNYLRGVFVILFYFKYTYFTSQASARVWVYC